MMNNHQIGVGHWQCSPLERKLVNEVLDSGRLSYGTKSQELEKRFSLAHNCKYGVLSNSGTSSLQVALQALKEIHNWQDGDIVLVPSLTFVATINVILHNRLKPVLIDVDPESYNLTYSSDLHRLFTMAREFNIRAIMPVHLFGQPAEIDVISEAAKSFGIKVIEDSCESVRATRYGQPVGSFGDIGCFSFYVAHLIATGVGGIATTNNPDYAKKMRSLVNHGRDGIYISIDDDNETSREIIERRFRFESIGHSFRITELEAALGLAQLASLDEMIQTRQQNASYLSEALAPLQDLIQLPTISPGSTHSFMMYPIVLRQESKQNLTFHLESKGIETREMLPLTNQPIYKNLFVEDAYPVAKWINQNGFYVGCHQGLSRDDMERIADEVFSYFGKQRVTR